MLVLALACLAVALAVGIVAMRTNARAADLGLALDTTLDERDALTEELAGLREVAATADRARVDALERVQRARRDAAEVADRLTAAVEAERLAVERSTVLERELADAGPASLLWELALVRVERTWRTSITLGLDEASPLSDPGSALRTAVEIEVEAAREEAGADITLEWMGEGMVEPAAAVQVLAVAGSVVAAVSKTARTTTLSVSVSPDAVDMVVDALDDEGQPVLVAVPEAIVDGPGRIRVTRGGPPGR